MPHDRTWIDQFENDDTGRFPRWLGTNSWHHLEVAYLFQMQYLWPVIRGQQTRQVGVEGK